MVGQLGRPQEVVVARDGVDRADEHLHTNLGDTLPGHGNTPIVCAIINHEELEYKNV